MDKNIEQILNMVSDGKISAEEAEKLITAVEKQDEIYKIDINETNSDAPKKKMSGKLLHIHVFEKKANGEKPTKVNVHVPLPLLKWGLKMGKNFDIGNDRVTNALKDVDIDEIIRMVEDGYEGTLVEVEEENTEIRIYIE